MNTSNTVVSSQPPKMPTMKAFLVASFRFIFSVGLALSLSWIFNAPKIGGFAAITCFLCLMVDPHTSLGGRLVGLLFTAVGVALSVAVGCLVMHHPYAKWIVLGVATFGMAILPFTEKFWWLASKNILIMFMISVFDFQPDYSTIVGFIVGVGIAGGSIIIDAFLWKKDKLGPSPIEQLKNLFRDDKNPLPFAVVSAVCLVLSIVTAQLFFKAMEPAWVGISVVYLVNTKLAAGLKKAIQRVGGALLGYVLCIFLVPFTLHENFLLAILIIISVSLIPYFIIKNYFIAYTCITVFILLILNWLLQAYGGDVSLLKWRFLDTVYGALWALICMFITDFKDIENWRKRWKERDEVTWQK